MRFDLLSNINDVIAQTQKQMPTVAGHDLEVVNPTTYAQYLHNKIGYWVMNDAVLAAYLTEELEIGVDVASLRGEVFGDMRRAQAEIRALQRTVRWYQAQVGSTDRPGRVKLPPRPTHPGNWADDTETLVRSYVTYLRAAGAVLRFEKYDNYPVA